MSEHFYTVIMAGGIGSRFWPLSKSNYPKQFQDILGTSKTLFKATYDRFTHICPQENIFTVTNKDYAPLVKEQAPDMTDDQILGEPIARNTAPCIAYAAHKLVEKDPQATMVIAPSDHLILNEDKYINSIDKALNYAHEHDILITLGIQPSRPDTGYGYIQMMEDKNIGDLKKVKTFTEKPNPELAEHFINSGEFLWNAGIFICSAQSILNAFRKHLPELYDNFQSSKGALNTKEEDAFIEETYPTLPLISIDYGVMEKADNVYVLTADFEWSDIGTWNSIYEYLNKDEENNAIKSKDVFARNTSNCIVNTKNDKLFALNNVEDLIIVESDDVVLIANRNKEQEIRHLVNEIKATFGERYI